MAKTFSLFSLFLHGVCVSWSKATDDGQFGIQAFYVIVVLPTNPTPILKGYSWSEQFFMGSKI